MRMQYRALFAFACALMIPSVGAAQPRPVPAAPADTKVNVAIALQVAGQLYNFDGKATCQHAPMASIYDVAAEMWIIQQRDAQHSMALTMWRPKNKTGDMFSLTLNSGGRSYIVSTVKTSGGGNAQGSGSVTLKPSGAGGAFTLGAKTENGVAITGTVKCSAFTAAVAEGGNWH